jgi:Secretion system C-terminal sorting domain
MKHLYKFLLLVTFPFSITAQPTITATGINGIPGEVYSYASGPYIFSGNAGANQFWDLSSATSTTAGTFTFLLPANTPFPTFSPSSNMCALNTINSNTLYSYFTQTPTTNQLNGYAFGNAPALNGTYSNPYTGLVFPFTYGNTFSDTYKSDYFLSSTVTAKRTGTITATADAYGTIITPLDTFYNTLRVSSTSTYSDSIFNGTSVSVTNYISYNIAWYLDGVHNALFTISNNEVNGTPNFSSTYLTSLPLKIENNLLDKNSLTLSPNPTAGLIRININNRLIKRIVIKDLNGKQLKVEDLTALNSKNLDFDISSLHNGVYIAEIETSDNRVIQKRIIKQ